MAEVSAHYAALFSSDPALKELRATLTAHVEAMADTDTSQFAHVKLPALTWGERDGTVTNSERRVSRQRAGSA